MRTQIFVTVLLMAAASAAAPPQAPASPAEKIKRLTSDCTMTTIAGGRMWQCPGVVASVADFPSVSAKIAAAANIAGMRTAMSKATLTTKETRYRSGASEWPALAIEATAAGGASSFVGNLLTLDREGGARLVLCGRNPTAADVCQELLPLLVEAGPEAFVVGPDETILLPPSLVQPGCRVVGVTERGYGVLCGTSSTKIERGTNITSLKADLATAVQKHLNLTRGERAGTVPCKVLGQATTCHKTKSPTFQHTLGAAAVRGVPVIVTCTEGPGEKNAREVCARFLTY